MLNQLMEEGVLAKDTGVRGYRILDREKLEQQAADVQRFLNRKNREGLYQTSLSRYENQGI